MSLIFEINRNISYAVTQLQEAHELDRLSLAFHTRSFICKQIKSPQSAYIENNFAYPIDKFIAESEELIVRYCSSLDFRAQWQALSSMTQYKFLLFSKNSLISLLSQLSLSEIKVPLQHVLLDSSLPHLHQQQLVQVANTMFSTQLKYGPSAYARRQFTHRVIKLIEQLQAAQQIGTWEIGPGERDITALDYYYLAVLYRETHARSAPEILLEVASSVQLARLEVSVQTLEFIKNSLTPQLFTALYSDHFPGLTILHLAQHYGQEISARAQRLSLQQSTPVALEGCAKNKI